MRSHTASILVAAWLAAAGACVPAPPVPRQGAAQDAAADPWPAVREARIRELLPQAMTRTGIDAWVVVCRENDNDPLALHVGGESVGSSVGILFLRQAGTVESVALSLPVESGALRDLGLHDRLVEFAASEDLWSSIARELVAADPARIAINSSERAVSDGLSQTQRERLERAVGPQLASRFVSSDELVVEWLSVKLPVELRILARAAELTARMQEEAFASVVPGRTREIDLARFLKRRMVALGVEAAWASAHNPHVNSGVDRGRSQPTERVIRSGDFIRTEFGIKVHGVWVTDIQRLAYVLAPDESAPLAEAMERWEKVLHGRRAAFEAMRPGVRGVDVDFAQRERTREAGSLPVPWSTGHAVGYWAQDVGPRLGDAQGASRPAGDALRELRPGQTFAFGGLFAWRPNGASEGETKTISVKEMVVVTDGGVRFLIPPQEQLILIPATRP